MGIAILATLCILLITIMIHETGHFLVAKRLGYAIDEFSIGMGPQLMQKTKNGIAYTLRLIPLGGYVRFSEESKNDKRCLFEPSWSNFLVLIMGVVFNVLLSILFCAIVYGIAGYDFFRSIYGGICLFWNLISVMFGSPSQLASVDSYGSIIAMTDTTNTIISMASNSKEAILYILLIGAILNISVAFMNLLPLPILDGGQIVINAVELAIKRRIPQGIRIALNGICWVTMMAFMAFLFVRDINNLV